MKSVKKTWLSRKFIIAVSVQVTALIVLLFPMYESDIMQFSQSITSLCVLVLTSLGYITVQGKIDGQESQSDQES